MENTIRLNVIRKAGLTFFMLFAFSAFISKAAVNIFSGAALFLSLVDILVNGTHKELVKNRLFLAFLLPLLLGLVLSLFSDAGLDGVPFFLSRYRFFFMILPFMTFIREKKHLYILFFILSLSACLAVSYGFVHAHLTDSAFDFEGLLIVGRNSDLLASLSLMNTVLLFEFEVKGSKSRFFVRTGLLISLVLTVAAILVIRQRGAMLGLYAGWMVYALFFNRKFLIGLIVLSCVSVLVLKKDNPIVTRVKSIVDLKNDASNLIRLHLFSTGFVYVIEEHLFFGTGDKNPEEDFTAFINSKGKAYKEKYSHAMEIPGNFHNSFLQIAAEGGVVFLVAYLFGILYVLCIMVVKLQDTEMRMFCMGAIVGTVGAFVMYFFHGELYRYGGIVFYVVLMSGCLQKRQTGKIMDFQVEISQIKPMLYGSQGPITPTQ